MSIVITTTQSSRSNGSGIIIAKGQGKQRTVSIDPAHSPNFNHAAAAGALLNVLTDARQQAMLRHPSGGQRIRVKSLSDAGGKHRFTIEV